MAADMGISQLDVIRQQTEDGLRRQAANAGARLGRDTSLVAEACRLTGCAEKQLENGIGRGSMGTRSSAPAPGATRSSDPATVRNEGGRRSPVQKLRIPPDYYKRILIRVAWGCVAFVALSILLWGILRSGLLIK